MLTFVGFINLASQKTVKFTPAEVSHMKEQVGKDAILELGDAQANGSVLVSVCYCGKRRKRFRLRVQRCS